MQTRQVMELQPITLKVEPVDREHICEELEAFIAKYHGSESASPSGLLNAIRIKLFNSLNNYLN